MYGTYVRTAAYYHIIFHLLKLLVFSGKMNVGKFESQASPVDGVLGIKVVWLWGLQCVPLASYQLLMALFRCANFWV